VETESAREHFIKATGISVATVFTGTMSLGALLSSATRLVLGDELAALEIAATTCAVAGSVAYLLSLRGPHQGKKLPRVVSISLFGCALIMLAVESIRA
jgi:hypothetical protein